MLRALLCMCCFFLLAGCSKPQFQGADIGGGALGGEFTLSDHTGKTRSLADFKDKVVVIFFGYTHCPDVCPTTMIELKNAMQQLGSKADQVQVLFVSVDPERDTKEVLRQYVPVFDSRFLGLSGTAAQLAEVAGRYKIIYQKQMSSSGDYTVDHSAGSYLLDKNGKPRVMVSYGAGASVFVHDLTLLLNE
ncbi:SCO family protein [Janthinobacterium sp. B9-8]|uniref:SCO family protein n=1 Tax=Janthinobacterium sp. B9-8 TaxID=1236179 RepID=UPI00061CFFE9|nr:SCO family protein [Janthinobacterium sp. B9-8]AMC33441.1 photosynthetic protein synthase I [Janthinobacterium sp. B9-8]